MNSELRIGWVETIWRKEGEVPPAECHPSGTFAARRALIGPGDAELGHLLLQSGTLHPQAGRGPLWTSHHPAGYAQDAEDMLPFGVGQRDRRTVRPIRGRGSGLQVVRRDVQYG